MTLDEVLKPDVIRLHAGELTPAEMRLALAVVRWAYIEGRKEGFTKEYSLADALDELLSDSQYASHEDCQDGGWCPVRDGRAALKDWQECVLGSELMRAFGVAEVEH